MAGSEDELDDEEATPLEEAATQVVTGLTLAVGLGLLFLGVSYFWVAFVVGFAGVLPAARAIAGYYDGQRDERESGVAGDANEPSDAEDALETLRERYARGDLSEVEFERRVERLLETESIDDANELFEAGRADGASDTGASDDAPADATVEGDTDATVDGDREFELDREQE